MMRYLRNTFIFLCVCFTLLISASLVLSAISGHAKTDAAVDVGLFVEALGDIRDQYVENTSTKDLVYGAITGMLANLDSHSQFLTPEEYIELKIDTEGKFGGIGVEITMKDNLITVVTPIEDTPAWKAGIQPNDRIVKIDDVLVKNWTLNSVVKALRGKPGVEVVLGVWREKDNGLHSFRLKRAMIDIRDIKEARLIDGRIGYLKLVEFREGTPQELERVLRDLKAQGAGAFIIDVRNNPGGLLDKAIESTEQFLPLGALIVSIKGRYPAEDESFKAKAKQPDVRTPLVVLINDGSASGSEIFASALKDHKRAVLLGTTSFGKGSVQTVLPLKDGSALKLTTSYYVTPSGQTIQGKGIEPEIVVPLSESDQGLVKDETAQDAEGIFQKVQETQPVEGSTLVAQKPKPKELKDPQLLRAIDLLKSLAI